MEGFRGAAKTAKVHDGCVRSLSDSWLGATRLRQHYRLGDPYKRIDAIGGRLSTPCLGPAPRASIDRPNSPCSMLIHHLSPSCVHMMSLPRTADVQGSHHSGRILGFGRSKLAVTRQSFVPHDSRNCCPNRDWRYPNISAAYKLVFRLSSVI